MPTLIKLLPALSLLIWAGSARAEEPLPVASDDGENEVITVVGKAVGKTPDSQAGFTTKISTEELAGETTSVAEVLGRSVGVNVRSLGGLGGFSSISVRGAAPSHTAIYIDGVPVSKLGTASHDLGAFELQSFSEIEVFRGAVPMRLGGAAMGGAVEFRSMQDLGGKVRISSGLGSFGATHLIAQTGAERGRWAYVASLGHRGATGDYRYFNDNGTLLRKDDDRFELRQNNGFDMVHAHARLRHQGEKTQIEAGSRTTVKVQGVPGLGSVQSQSSSLESASQLADAGIRYRNGGLRLAGKSYVFVDQQEYRDVMGEVGLGNQHNRYRTTSSGVMGTLESLLSPAHLLKASLELGYERFASHDFMDSSVAPARAWRGTAGVAVADEIIVGSSLKLTPILRFDAQRTSAGLDWDPIIAGDSGTARTDSFLSPRVTASYSLGDMEFKASAGRYFRAPTSTELFGDRGFIVGNPELLAETGLSGDLGFVQLWQDAPWPARDLYVQGALFVSRQSDAIVMLPTSGGAALAQNLGDAEIRGVEASMHAEFAGGLSLSGNYTRIASEQRNSLQSYEGKNLPLRPRHQIYTRVGYEPGYFSRASIFADLAYTSGNFLDAANRNQVPRRVLLGAGLKMKLSQRFLAGVSLKNLLNRHVENIALDPPPRPDLASVPRAVSDFMGYPLPGRSIYFTLNATI